jgi:hypothetical protein
LGQRPAPAEVVPTLRFHTKASHHTAMPSGRRGHGRLPELASGGRHWKKLEDLRASLWRAGGHLLGAPGRLRQAGPRGAPVRLLAGTGWRSFPF